MFFFQWPLLYIIFNEVLCKTEKKHENVILCTIINYVGIAIISINRCTVSVCLFTSGTEGGWRWCFHPCLSVCTSVCEQDISKFYGRNQTKRWKGWVCDKDKWIQFWWISASSDANFWPKRETPFTEKPTFEHNTTRASPYCLVFTTCSFRHWRRHTQIFQGTACSPMAKIILN